MVLKEDSVPTAKFPTDAHDGDPSLSRHHSVSSPPSIFLFHATGSSDSFKNVLLALWGGGQREVRGGLFLMKESSNSSYFVFHFALPMVRTHGYSLQLYIFTSPERRIFLLLTMLEGCFRSLESVSSSMNSLIPGTDCSILCPLYWLLGGGLPL